MNASPKIGVIIVTRNRLPLLQQCVAAIRSQTILPQFIFVVDNGSADGSVDWLKEQNDLKTLFQQNSGCAGGMYEGIRRNFESDCDWFWCMDDDTVPEKEALAAMCRTAEFDDPETGFLSSLVKWTDGNLHLMNLPIISGHSGWIDKVLEKRTIPTHSASFVSLLVSRRAIEECGLPIKDLFIWGDDTEFTRRISKRFKCYTCLESVATHVTENNLADSLKALSEQTLWKYRFGYRNNAYLLAMEDGAAWRKALQLLRRIRILFGELKTLEKTRFFPDLLRAMVHGFFGFRPTIDFPGEERANELPGEIAQ